MTAIQDSGSPWRLCNPHTLRSVPSSLRCGTVVGLASLALACTCVGGAAAAIGVRYLPKEEEVASPEGRKMLGPRHFAIVVT
eukprot:CAMPEP_0194748052 /NCGR_PEP_ID=MMETSP0323_2-20130528/2260_1 /TAXON_ID=2866 ORGANISM="Crypthecodinium cohnii, Strain Seligo" /NCGR_SAMPLE_ID=MMETSP0323_2 /ASSEMBLY_ACC=CAM_ASM_000346 /LENGTH=81 /DNA_ID=CAMNT_0039662055 /DNA_START=114 /DNA_END=359 /DNA_ORIENTATION=+